MPPESRFAEQYVPMLGVRKGLYAKRSRSSAIVVHTTGSGPVVRMTSPRFEHWRRKTKITTPLDAAVWIYTFAHNAGGHYLVSQDGRIIQTAPEELAVWQVGGARANLMRNPGAITLKWPWWHQRWPELGTPYNLAGGHLWDPWPNNHPGLANSVLRAAKHGSCNAGAIGIEVVPPEQNPQAPWSKAAQRAVSTLIEDLTFRHGIPCDRYHVISHSDASPMSRTDGRGQPWDPCPAQWPF